MENIIKCLFCKKSHYIKWGTRQTQNRGKIQKYKCLNCCRHFTNDEGFYKMKNSEDKITEAIDLYFSNLSSRKVRNHFRRHKSKNASHVTILDWCRKYVLKVHKYIDTLEPKIAGNCYADSTAIDCEKRKDNFWACVDYGTRYINATHYSLKLDVEEAIEFLTKATNKQLPKYIQTDSAMFYPKAFQKLFYSNKLKGLKVEHKIVNTLRTGKYNVRIETVFSNIKDMVDDFRGLKALWSAPILLQGMILQHNLIEAHTTTGQIPSELAGLKLDCGVNRWLGLIRISANQI